MSNRLRIEREETTPPAKSPRKIKKARRFIRLLNVFGIFDRHQVVQYMPFVLFITVLLLFYIGNTYYAERTVREINKVKTELKEKRSEFIYSSSELMSKTLQSEVAKAVAPMELKVSVEPQKKVLVQKEKKQ